MEMDAGTLMALMKDNDGFEFIWVLLIFLMFGMGGNGFGRGAGSGGVSDLESAVRAANCSQSDMTNLLSAINGNNVAIQNLATTMGCDFNQVSSGIHQLSAGLGQIGNQVNLSGRDVMHSICTGNQQLATQLAECCCSTQRAVDGVNFAAANNTRDIMSAMSDCCCQTQRAIDASNLAACNNTRDILQSMQAGHCDTQRLIDNLNFQSCNNTSQLNQAIRDCCCQTQLGTERLGTALVSEAKDIRSQTAADICDLRNQIASEIGATRNLINLNNLELQNNMNTQFVRLENEQALGFRAVLDKISEVETDRLRAELTQCKADLSQQQQTLAIEQMIRNQMFPCPPCAATTAIR